ncbi:MAG: tubulin-like doman-containing protein, partial [Bifidobacteriaceae bacterium]|nr:tubulin-like doman-containing protein [Bifidobacteriaceae bacterium]
MALTPFVFIGVGGSGGKTLGVIRQTLKNQLGRIGWDGGIPRGWQFIHVDVPADSDARSEDLLDAVPRTDYAALTDRQSTYANYAVSLNQRVADATPDSALRYQAWDCWQPFPPQVVGASVNISSGAGQFRGIGRVCSLQSLEKVDQKIQGALRAVAEAEVAQQLNNIQLLSGDVPINPVAGQPVAFVVGSVSGGSGSGLFLDVCAILRAKGLKQVISLIFTPEVFTGSDGTMEPGVAPNTFMALNEVTNATWSVPQGSVQPARALLYQAAGVAYPLGPAAPTTVLLVGRGNGNVRFAKPDDVYKTVGRSLAELALNEAMTQEIVNYDIANGAAIAAGGHDRLNLSSTRPGAVKDRAPFRALGFSRLSVGRDFFEPYVIDRLTRAAILRLLDGHLLRQRPGESLPDQELLDRAVDSAWSDFLDATGLDEYGDSNDVTERLSTLEQLEIIDDLKVNLRPRLR